MPDKMDDDKKLPSIEEEFAELDAELKRISALPVETPEQRNGLLLALENLRAEWLEKGRALPADAPPWRRAVDDAITVGFDGIIGDLQRGGVPGYQFNLSNELVMRHLKPVFDALTDGLKQNLVTKFGKRPPPGAPPPKVDAADVAGMLVTLFGPNKKK
jgi:hypothetical protein